MRASAELPPGIPPGELYLLFSLDEFHLGTDAQGRAVAELAVPTENWRATENLRALAGVKSGPASGDRVLVVEVNGHASSHTCPPPAAPGVAWSSGAAVESVGPYARVQLYFPGGEISEVVGVIFTDDMDFRPGHRVATEDHLNAMFTDVTGHTSINPDEVAAGDDVLLTVTHSVGRLGLPVGGQVDFVLADNGWQEPQIREPTAPGFLTIHNTGRASTEIQTVIPPGNPEFPDYWRIRAEVTRVGMSAGDAVTLVYGDRSRGGSGAIAPSAPFAYRHTRLRKRTDLLPPLTVISDRHDLGRWAPVAKGRGHEFSVAPGETQRFVVLAAGHAVIGEPHAINIIATDGYLNPAEPKFRGSVRLDFDGAPRMEIISEAFLDTDDGIKTIMWTPEEPGTVRVIVDDSTGRRGVSNPILVLEEPPKETIYFGDMGVRSEFSGGRGTVAENLEFARDVGYLDFCCVADRSNLLTSTRWAVSQRQADRFNRDGEFVAFVGYEWNDAAAADDTRSPGTRTVISGGDRLPLVNHGDTGSSLRQLWTRVGEAEEILAFANHPIEDASWDQYNPAFETAVEIYSSYGPSENRGQRPVHDEQGRGISVEEILSTGARVFLIGNSSGHEGVPGINQLESLVRSLHGWRPFSGGLTGVMAENLTRSCILEAIRAGRVYATTGNRTLLSFSLNEAPMGSELRLRARERRHFSARIVADGQLLRRVEIIRNGESVVSQTAAGGIHTLNWEDRVRTAGEDYYYLRVTMWDTRLAWSSPIWVRPIGDNRLSQDLVKGSGAVGWRGGTGQFVER